MGRHKKDGAQRQSPDGTLSCRARRTMPTSYSKWASSCRTSSDMESATYSYGVGLALLSRSCPCSDAALNDFWRLWYNVAESGDVLGFIEACSTIRLALVKAGWWESSLSKGKQPRWVKGICAAICKAVPCALIVHPSPVFDSIVTFLGWLKRLPVFVRPTEQSVDAYFACDRRLASVDFTENVYVPMLRGIWKEWFGSFELRTPFRAKHGSGATADKGRVRSQKWDRLVVDRVSHVCLRGADLLPLVRDPVVPKATRVSKVVFVPKQAGKDRSICMEPAWIQYLQQGVKDQLVEYTHRIDHPLSRLVNIFSQEENRRLCALAYIEGYATIDLSDASDSVSWRLIKALTIGMPLYKYLKGTRSTHTTLGGYTVKMDKFAPMGSALCFPIECYVFASVVELAYRLHYGCASRGAASGCSIYGDDIVVPQVLYQHVCSILESLGFVVNESKSYCDSLYYESCGVEYCAGARIQTVRHPRAHLISHEVETPDKVSLITDLANTLHDANYRSARRLLLKTHEESIIPVGRKRYKFMDLLQFDSEHLVPGGEVYRRYVWSPDYQRSGYLQKVIEQRVALGEHGFLEWGSRFNERSRDERLASLDRGVTDVAISERWCSDLSTLLRIIGLTEMLESGDVKRVGGVKTGEARYRVRKYFVPKPSTLL